MSDIDVLDPRDEIDRDWLCELLDEPARAAAIAGGDGEKSDAGSRCEYLALLGLLTEDVEPVAVPPQLEGRVLAAAGVAEGPLSGRREVTARDRARSWLLPLAATVAFAALALSVWQNARLGELRAVVARQAEELARARAAGDRLARIEAENTAQAEALALLTAAGVEFCPLRPPASSPTPQAYGALAMSREGGHWYLRVVGLEPRTGGEYRLWFLQDGDPVEGVVLPALSAGGELEMMKGTTPAVFNAVVITLEPAGSDSPQGPRLLFGNERMIIL